MSAIMEQHNRWMEARKRLMGGNNAVRTDKVVKLLDVTGKIVRIDPSVPLPTERSKRPRPGAGYKHAGLSAADEQVAKAIIRDVARRRHVSVPALMSKQRINNVTRARHEIYYRLLTEVAMSSVEIGDMFGGKDRTAILHGARQYAKRYGKDEP